MNNLKIYEIIEPYVGKNVTLVLNSGRRFKKTGKLIINESHSHISVKGDDACAQIPLSEKAKVLDSIIDDNGIIIYKNNNLEKIDHKAKHLAKKII